MWDVIVSWWNTVYVDWLDRNTFWMVVIGWEIFILPIVVAFKVVWLSLVLLVSSLQTRRDAR